MKNPWDFNNKEEKTDNSSKKEENKNSKNTANDNKNIEDIAKEIFKNIQQSTSPKKPNNTNSKSSRGFVYTIISLLLCLWLLNGLYKVNSDENAVVLYFGKYFETTTPGLHFYIPAPIGQIVKVPVTRINKEEFGFSTTANKKNFDEESLMLTGDENIADIDFEVQWKIGDVEEYLFNIKDQQSTIRNATASVIREVIAHKKIDDILANKKFEIESEAKELLQNILNSYNAGIDIIAVQLLRADPPKEVIESFRDVQTAKADKERKINEAKSYNNDVMPKARGEAETLLQEAEAYKKSIVAKAEGETARFNKIYNEYRNNRAITKKRLYLETLEEVMKDNNKVIVDKNLNNGLLKLLSD